MFLGPSPLALHCGLLSTPVGDETVNGSTVEIWQEMRRLFEEDLGGRWDLYVVQMLPCSWREFLVATRKHADAPESGAIKWLTDARRQVERLFEVETVQLQEVARWVHHLNLREEFAALPGAAQKQVVDTIRLLPTLKKEAAVKDFRNSPYTRAL